MNPSQEINVVAYAGDLVRRIFAVAATRDVYDVRTPAAWAELFRAEMSCLK